LLGDVKARLFSAYRYKAYNGSLGETDVYSAFGSFLEKRGAFSMWASFPTITSGASELETIKPNNLKVKTSPIYGEQISTDL